MALTLVAYRSQVSIRARSGALAATIAVHLLLLLMLLTLSQSRERTLVQPALHVIDLSALPSASPQPRQERLVPKPSPQRSSKDEANRSSSTPRSELSPPVQGVPAPALETPAKGPPSPPAPAGNGSSIGAGTGGAGAGGEGSAGGDDLSEPPRLVSPVLSGRDFSSEQLEQWPRGAPVFLRLRVDENGFVAECIMDRRTGVAVIDSDMCNMAHERLRFRPAVNPRGQRVAGWFGYAQPAPR